MANATTAAEWDEEYRAGRWNFLSDVKESARYGVHAAWLASVGKTRAILDVGCGEGLLWHNLPRRPEHYVGVDLSAAAFDKADIDFDSCRLEAADLHHFQPAQDEIFSAVVFNEVLYFCEEPEIQLPRYAAMLEEGGVMSISLYAPNRPESGAHKLISRIWETTDQWDVLDDITMTSAAKNVTWKMRLVRP
ncbi:class I SAM-dependent methyltransferase [Breoghania sp.]|uniref:class I SAM-dependent methyltransferase n=1 Tax=Breoghania sp. TaxID=2065378 RepID=UPI002AAAB3D4|nr:class I SAM-dependent methyltransferase [Breoghania sp.]